MTLWKRRGGRHCRIRTRIWSGRKACRTRRRRAPKPIGWPERPGVRDAPRIARGEAAARTAEAGDDPGRTRHPVDGDPVWRGAYPEPGGEAWAAKNETQKKNLEANSKYYEEARKFARLCSQHSAASYYREFVVITGGGPRHGSRQPRCRRCRRTFDRLNIVLPHEQAPNASM